MVQGEGEDEARDQSRNFCSKVWGQILAWCRSGNDNDDDDGGGDDEPPVDEAEALRRRVVRARVEREWGPHFAARMDAAWHKADVEERDGVPIDRQFDTGNGALMVALGMINLVDNFKRIKQEDVEMGLRLFSFLRYWSWLFEIASLDIGRMTVMLYLSFQETDFQVQSPWQPASVPPCRIVSQQDRGDVVSGGAQGLASAVPCRAAVRDVESAGAQGR